MENVLLIGLGYHARRIYYPVLQELQRKREIGKIYVLDLLGQREAICRYLKEKRVKDYECFWLEKPENDKLNEKTLNWLNDISENIKGVIIATEPLAHLVYAKWALKKGLSILMDKPISTHEGIITDKALGKMLIKDYFDLVAIYKESKKNNPNQIFIIMAQRRFHNAYELMKDKIKEVFQYTNCPVTLVQSFHGDGQWRFPTEIIEQTAHPYNQGYGKCSHSGYHFFDISFWLAEAGYSKDKKPDEFEVTTSFLTPNDFLAQYTFDDYRNNFPDFDKFNKYTKEEFENKTKDYGEIDALSNFVFKKDGRVMTLINVNLCHNGFSQRNWTTAEGRDLYKGNGRVRHEFHYVLQGPFQAINYQSYQSKEVDPNIEKNLYNIGGEHHADIYIFRNSTFNSNWKCVEKYQTKDLIVSQMKDKSRGHQEDARRKAILDFVANLKTGDRIASEKSDLILYETSVKMMSAAYQSMANRKQGKNPLVKIKL